MLCTAAITTSQGALDPDLIVPVVEKLFVGGAAGSV